LLIEGNQGVQQLSLLADDDESFKNPEAAAGGSRLASCKPAAHDDGPHGGLTGQWPVCPLSHSLLVVRLLDSRPLWIPTHTTQTRTGVLLFSCGASPTGQAGRPPSQFLGGQIFCWRPSLTTVVRRMFLGWGVRTTRRRGGQRPSTLSVVLGWPLLSCVVRGFQGGGSASFFLLAATGSWPARRSSSSAHTHPLQPSAAGGTSFTPTRNICAHPESPCAYMHRPLC
jgi:hypothetical protein